jgi:hypothetical protein
LKSVIWLVGVLLTLVAAGGIAVAGARGLANQAIRKADVQARDVEWIKETLQQINDKLDKR